MIAHTPDSASAATHIGRKVITDAIATGELTAHYIGSKRIILATDLADWIATLPTERAS